MNNAETATAISGVAAVATPSVVTLEVAGASASGSGSGVIYNEDGYIITNAHVVTLDGAAAQDPTIRVKLSDGRILDGKLVDIDPYADLAVVKVDATGLPAIQIADSDSLNVGDLTVAIGAPLNLASTVTSGVVSSLYRGITVGSALIPQAPSTPQDESDGGSGMPWDFRFNTPDESAPQQEQPQQQTTGGAVTLPVIQTDASINPGNSGGALLNGKGELIGINVAIASPTSSNGVAGSDGLGFAIPANLASRVADSIIAGDQPSHGLLGASVADSTQDTDADANHAGGLLVEIIKGGSAEKAGLRAGDVITAVNGVPAVDGTSVSALVRMNAGGSTVTIDYTRGGVAGQTDAKLGTLEW
nr:trypsin-like peptidase domain-containing protein [Leucobacter exalbidus]